MSSAKTENQAMTACSYWCSTLNYSSSLVLPTFCLPSFLLPAIQGLPDADHFVTLSPELCDVTLLN